jgi:hypothetical protein
MTLRRKGAAVLRPYKEKERKGKKKNDKERKRGEKVT